MSDRDRYVRLPGLPGEVFVPRRKGRKKHPCPDCFECQWCSDARCASCCGACSRKEGGSGGRGEGSDAGGEEG